jgi:hypothetical protein
MAAGKPNAVITYHFNSSGCHSYRQEKEEYCCLFLFRHAVGEVERKKYEGFTVCDNASYTRRSTCAT